MKVWVAMRDCFEDQYMAGVFATLEAAKAQFPGEFSLVEGTYRWTADGTEVTDTGSEWRNGLRRQDYVTISAVEVQE